MLTGLLLHLESWSVASALRTSLYAYPLVNAAHILGLGLLIGSILPADLRLLGAFRRLPLAEMVSVLAGVAALGLGITVITGFLLFSVNPLDYAGNSAFRIKMILVAIGAMNALTLRFVPAWRESRDRGVATPGVRFAALVSIAVWPSALVAGRWIGFL